MELLNHPDLPPGIVALSDQDDVWLPEKLTRALIEIGQFPNDEPVLYCAQSRYVDANLTPIGYSNAPRRAPCFGNALTQCITRGHSIVLNAKALVLVRRVGVPQGIIFHDWWLYQLISGAGCKVHIDANKVLLYRQHDQNLMGAHHGPKAIRKRISIVLGRQYGRWIAANVAALARVAGLLTDRNQNLLAIIQVNRRSGLMSAWRLAQAGLYRQQILGTIFFYLAVALKRF